MKTINALLIDDHPLILEGYRNVIEKADIDGVKVKIDTVENCEDAWNQIQSNQIDLVVLDINFPVLPESKFFSGEDLGSKIKEQCPNTKLIILTVIEDSFRLKNIMFNVKPDGFLLKGDTSSEELLYCLDRVINESSFFGSKVTKLLQSDYFNQHLIDETDRLMLYQLSLGTKTKDLPAYVNLSLRAVEDRKRKLKEVFGANNNKSLLEQARKSGYI